MRKTKKIAEIDRDACVGCEMCAKVCPVLAIEMVKDGGKKKAEVDAGLCTACTICTARCPVNAIKMGDRETELAVGVEVKEVTPEIERICTAAHMLPDQIVCYCNRTQAKEIAQAIIEGADSPIEVSRRTGARVGCSVLCQTGVMRLLKGAGIDYGEAPGYQWYEMKTIWDIPEKVIQERPEFYVAEDRKCLADIFPGGER